MVVTGRLSVARQVAWDPPKCERFRDTRTVQDALEGLIRTREIRCLGGDGQAVREQGEVVQRPVRVVVVDGCGPVAGAAVTARAGNRITGPGRVAEAKEGEPAPATLGPDAQVTVRTGEDGVAAFWWLPFFGNGNWSTLDIGLEGAGDAPIRVVANLDAGGSAGRTAGVHIAELTFVNGRRFQNDDTVGLEDLASGIRVGLDGPVVAATVVGKPVVRVVLGMQWPGGDEVGIWNAPGALGVHSVEIAAELETDGDEIRWVPAPEVAEWLEKKLVALLPDLRRPIVGRFVVDGWAIVSRKDPRQHLNGHAEAFVDDGSGRTAAAAADGRRDRRRPVRPVVPAGARCRTPVRRGPRRGRAHHGRGAPRDRGARAGRRHVVRAQWGAQGPGPARRPRARHGPPRRGHGVRHRVQGSRRVARWPRVPRVIAAPTGSPGRRRSAPRRRPRAAGRPTSPRCRRGTTWAGARCGPPSGRCGPPG